MPAHPARPSSIAAATVPTANLCIFFMALLLDLMKREVMPPRIARVMHLTLPRAFEDRRGCIAALPDPARLKARMRTDGGRVPLQSVCCRTLHRHRTSPRPRPVADLGHVLAMALDVFLVLD